MPRPARRLLLLPLLLLIPLGALKWRADHPPISGADETIRAILGQAQEVYLTGEGPLWHHLTGLSDRQNITTKNRLVFHQLTEALRCEERQLPLTHLAPLDSLPGGCVYLTARTSNPKVPWDGFPYWRDTKASYVLLCDLRHPSFSRAYVQPRFAPKFEALVAQLAQRAKALGQHPEIVLGKDL